MAADQSGRSRSCPLRCRPSAPRLDCDLFGLRKTLTPKPTEDCDTAKGIMAEWAIYRRKGFS
eukprot:1733901-Pleurochrysis_carterae.AAC.5